MPQARDDAGNIWETDAQGNPVRLVQAAQTGGQVFSLPENPRQVAQDRRADNADQRAADAAARAAATAERNATNDASRLALDRQKFLADLAAKGLTTDGTGKVIRDPNAPTARNNKNEGRLGTLNSLVNQINRTQELFDEGPAKTTGVRGLRDYFPTDANNQFDRASAMLSQMGIAAFRVPGSGAMTDADQRLFDEAYRPSSGTRDSGVREQLRGMRNRVEQEIRTLGGQPPKWTGGIPQDEKDDRERLYGAAPASGGVGGDAGGNGPGSVWQQTFTTPGAPPGAAGQGATTQGMPIDPRMQAELNDFIQRNGANLDPQTLRAYIDSLYGKYGGQPGAGLDDYAAGTAQALRNGGQINTNIPPQTVPLSGLDRAWNNVAASPVGTAFVNSADATGWGALSLLQRDKLNAANDLNTISATAGQIAGSIGGTGLTGMFGRGIAKRAAPSLLGGGARAQLARDLGADAVYSGIYGSNQGQDAGLSAAVGVGGSLIGRGVGRAAGGLVGGLGMPEAVQTLRNSGIGTTVGQSLGGLAKRTEDAMTSIPGVGDLIGARRLEGFKDFNRAVLNEAGEPINATISNVGESGLNELSDQIGDAYRNATSGVNIPLDPQFSTDVAGIATNRLPADYASRLDKVIENRVQPILDNGALTGDLYQQSMRGLKGSRSSASGAAPGFEQDYRDVLTQGMDAIKGQMQRGGGQQVVDDLAAADRANRLMKTAQAAASSAKNGTGSGEIQVFTPAQLNAAAYATQRKFPGPRPFAELADAGQQVLPSAIPDSGTGRRLAQMAALPGGLAAGGGAYGAATGGDDRLGGASSGALTGLALAAALGLGGTKAGQKALDNVLFVRPDAARIAGKKLAKARRMFGAGFIPLALPLAGE